MRVSLNQKSSTSSSCKGQEAGPDGVIRYTERQNNTWAELMARQLQLLPGRVCQEFLDGLEALALPHDRIPQLVDVNRTLAATTGWQVEQVSEWPGSNCFFAMLANKALPVTTSIRPHKDMDYPKRPDIFHGLFGHCPLLTNPVCAEFTHNLGKLGLEAGAPQRVYLARLYWFTMGYGLIRTADGVRIYGGGILASPKETWWSLESVAPRRESFDPVLALRTPYRADILQPLYYVIDDINTLNELRQKDIMLMVAEARQTGLLPPLFTDD